VGVSDDSSIKVTLNTVYQTQLEQSASLVEIKGSLALMTQTMTSAAATSADHESRIRALEKNSLTRGGLYAALAAMAAVGGIASSLVSVWVR
jgi:hypothetical protein